MRAPVSEAPRPGFVVETSTFSGPFDLLLQLITRHQVDIYEVPLCKIVDDYLAAIAEAFDLDNATEFLLIAATLVELKTAALLPEPDFIDLDEELATMEERDLLISRLLAAKTFRDASRIIERGLDEGSAYFPRLGMETQFIHACPDLLAQVGPLDLARIAALALADRPVPMVDTSHIAAIGPTVRDAMSSVARLLPGRGRRGMRDLVPSRSRLAAIVTFLALLELYKQGLVELFQATTFGELSAQWIEGEQPPDWSGASEWDEPGPDRGSDQGRDSSADQGGEGR
jgi:segregation and condensation protein A